MAEPDDFPGGPLQERERQQTRLLWWERQATVEQRQRWRAQIGLYGALISAAGGLAVLIINIRAIAGALYRLLVSP
jgi:hypothetical protein